MDITTTILRDQEHRARLSAGKSRRFEALDISLGESLDVLASQLLRLGWTVRMQRMGSDSQVGVLAVSARAFSPAELVQLDAQRRMSLITSGESFPVVDVAELVGVLLRRRASQAVPGAIEHHRSRPATPRPRCINPASNSIS